jgi:hypothetical protein
MAIPGIQEIQTLATKYSKTQLQKMAQMGLIDTTKAVMAGMMIDRISKQNMTPPVTTVAEDALTPPQAPPQAAPQGPPQMGPGGAPPERSAGIAALQSNIPEMAGGGIVAFADGGDMPSFAGDQGSFIDPEFRTKDPEKIRQAKLKIYSDELRDEQAKAARLSGDDRLRSESNIAEIQKEMRKLMSKGPDINLPGVSSATASELPVKKVDSAPSGQAPVKTLEESDREGFMGGFKNLGAAAKDILSMPGRAIVGLGENILTRPLRAAGVDIPYIDPEFYGETDRDRKGPPSFSLTPYYDQLRKDNTAIDLPPIVTPGKNVAPVVPAAPERFVSPVVEAPVDQSVPIRKERGAPEDFTKITPEQIAVPAATSLKEERERREGAYSEAGVDTNMYKEMMAEVASRKEGGAKKREQALGMALMMTGLGLAGARRGQEFQTLSGAGRQALAQFQGTMDNIVANEDKLDNMVRELKMAENNYRKTGAESDLARVRAREDKIEAIGAKNTELKQAAETKSKELFVHLQGVTKPGPVVEATNMILEDMRATNPKATFQDAFRAYSTTGIKSGEITKTTAYKEYNDRIMGDPTRTFEKKYPEFKDYWADVQKNLDVSMPKGLLAPGKDGTFNYVPGGK